MGNTASTCETTTVPLHLRKYLHGLCFIGIWHVYLNMYAQYIPTENLEISTSSQKLPVQQKLFPEQKLPGCSEGTCTVAKCQRCCRRYICVNMYIGWLGLRRGHLVKKNSLRRQRHQRVLGLIWVSYFVWFDCLGAEEDDTLDWARGPGVLGLGVYVYNCFCISFIFIMSWIVPGVQEYWAPSEQQNIWEKYRNRLLHIICQRCWKRA